MSYSPSSNISGPLSTFFIRCKQSGVEAFLNQAVALQGGWSFVFKNTGSKLVLITDRETKHFLEPADTLSLYYPYSHSTLPEVVSLNNGI